MEGGGRLIVTLTITISAKHLPVSVTAELVEPRCHGTGKHVTAWLAYEDRSATAGSRYVIAELSWHIYVY